MAPSKDDSLAAEAEERLARVLVPAKGAARVDDGQADASDWLSPHLLHLAQLDV